MFNLTEYGRLMCIVNEKVDVSPADLDANAWAYQPNLSLDNLRIKVETECQCDILKKFLDNVNHIFELLMGMCSQII